jgi:hypothetical protein
MKTIYSFLFLALSGCILLLMLVAVPAVSQRIVDSKYQIKTYRIGNSLIKGMIVETQFDTGAPIIFLFLIPIKEFTPDPGVQIYIVVEKHVLLAAGRIRPLYGAALRRKIRTVIAPRLDTSASIITDSWGCTPTRHTL